MEREKGEIKRMRVFFVFLLFSVFFAGNLYPVNLKEIIREKKLPVYIVKDQSYISLNSFIEALKPESWGKIEDRVFIVYNGTQIKFRIGEEKVIAGENTFTLKYPPKEIEGEILIPLDDFSYIISQISTKTKENKQIEETPAPSIEGKKPYIILIDPGHGGKDTGAIGNFGLKEKDVNLDVSLRLANFLHRQLEKYPYIKIYLTRNKDIFLTLEERVQMAKDINTNMFFCIHTNSSRYNRYRASGFETYYSKTKEEVESLPHATNSEGVLSEETGEDTILSEILKDLNSTDTLEESKVLAEFVQEKLAERLLTPDRGARPGNFYVLRYTPMVSILVEIGFICNPNIELNLRDAEVRQAIAESLGNAIIEYLKSRKIIEE